MSGEQQAGRDSPRHLDVVIRIRALMPHMSAAEARIGHILQNNPGTAATWTIKELATKGGTSTATVVRTARRLGYDGYPQLRLALAAHSGAIDDPPDVADIVRGDTIEVILHKLAIFEADQLQATAGLADPVAMQAIVDRILTARRIDLYGIGASALATHDIEAKLRRIGLDARAHCEHDNAIVSASLLGPEDLALGISHSGENRGSWRPLAVAVSNGASTAAITGQPRSTITSHASHIVITAGREFGFRSAAMASRSAQLLIIDALFIAVAAALPDAQKALRRTYEALAPKRARRHDRQDSL